MELFKKDSHGKIRVWKTWTDGSKLIQEYGLVDGKKVLDSKESKPKNIGKSNETTGAEQAILEMESKIKSKLDEGYVSSIEEALNNIIILPMLANDFKKTKHIDWSTAYSQAKYDGMRCLAIIKNGTVTLLSRAGKVIENMDHIIKELSLIKEDIILDGELYSMELGSFQEQMKAIKKYRKGVSEMVNYNVYDMISDEPYSLRHMRFFNLLMEHSFNSIKIVNTKVVSESDLKDHHIENLKNGFEGTMVRYGDEGYKMDARSKNLLKYKDFIDIVAEVIDVIPSDARPTQGIVVCKLDNGGVFKATPKMSHEDREELLTNKHEYIGQKAEIRFFEYTDDGLPRFPVCYGFRLDK